MSKQALIVAGALIIGLVCGYFLGREHLKYEIRSTMKQAFSGLGEAIQGKTKEKDTKPKPKSKEKTEYIQKYLELYEIKASYHKDYLEGEVAAFFGKLRNNGNRTIKKVEITAYFLDDVGRVVFEASYHPVFVGGLMSEGPPLKPNYIKEFGYKAKACPTEWSEGKVKVAITDIEFE